MLKEYAIYLRNIFLRYIGSDGEYFTRLNRYANGKGEPPTKEILNNIAIDMKIYFPTIQKLAVIYLYDEFVIKQRDTKLDILI
jgi:hypothetical protein